MTHGGPSPLIGQPRAIAALTRAFARDRLHHAWILHGPMGVGKSLAARLFAGLVLDPETAPADIAAFAPPEGTEDATLLDAGTHPDFIVIRKELAAVSQSRELRERKQLNIPVDLLRETLIGGVDGEGRMLDSAVQRTPARGRAKVFVIDEAELLESEAQNVLLKTLEEPPLGTYLFLVTSREDRLLPTIRSRCHRVGFGPLSDEAMRQWESRQDWKAGDAERAWLRSFAAGSPGLALLGAKFGLHRWWQSLHPQFKQLDQGQFPPTLAEEMAKCAEEYAELLVKENENASKDAANRQGVSMLVRLAGLHLRQKLHAAANAGDREALDATQRAMLTLDNFEEAVRANVNLKLVLASLVAAWSQVGVAVASR
ncbi:MAG: AAA family ATPase [Planctomycetes bacterium]|nr:AAA family ATPase [Planctomycetota bacterium]